MDLRKPNHSLYFKMKIFIWNLGRYITKRICCYLVQVLNNFSEDLHPSDQIWEIIDFENLWQVWRAPGIRVMCLGKWLWMKNAINVAHAMLIPSMWRVYMHHVISIDIIYFFTHLFTQMELMWVSRNSLISL